jgi:hypothetical protein
VLTLKDTDIRLLIVKILADEATRK